jgi:hypothetical protein
MFAVGSVVQDFELAFSRRSGGEAAAVERTMPIYDPDIAMRMRSAASYGADLLMDCDSTCSDTDRAKVCLRLYVM